MASALHCAGLDINPAVGTAAATEFCSYISMYENLPNLIAILDGKGETIQFPKEPSVRYATVIGLTVRADNANQALNAFNWLNRVASNEWVRLYAVDLKRIMESKGKLGVLANMLNKEPEFKKLLQDYLESQKP